MLIKEITENIYTYKMDPIPKIIYIVKYKDNHYYVQQETVDDVNINRIENGDYRVCYKNTKAQACFIAVLNQFTLDETENSTSFLDLKKAQAHCVKKNINNYEATIAAYEKIMRENLEKLKETKLKYAKYMEDING